MGNDLISRSALLEMIRPVEQDDCRSAVLMSDAKKIICNFIRNAPTVDAVEVVRCKDCKWWRNETCTNVNGAGGYISNGEWFCRSGERRADDGK